MSEQSSKISSSVNIEKALQDGEFERKVQTFIAMNIQTLSEFKQSLQNAKHFINLASLSKSKEPENTIIMLRQIMDFNIHAILEKQYSSFQGAATVMPRNPFLAELDKQYHELISEAKAQSELCEAILDQINNKHQTV